MTGGRAESSSRKTAGPAPTFARLLRRAVYRSAASTTTLTPKQRSWVQPWQACGTDNSMPQCAQSGMGFPDGWGFGKCVPEFAFGMGCGFPLDRKWKACPGIWLWNGMGFPVEGLGGKCIPESGRRMGCSFRMGSPRKACPGIGAQGGMRFPDGAVGGNCIPIYAGILGWVFRGRADGRNDDVSIGADFIPFGKMRHAVRKNETREIACFV